MKRIIVTAFFALLLIPLISQVVIIPKSDIIEMRNGKSYYIHTVQKGQTIYSIAKVYDVSTDEIYFENPDTKKGISINQELLIPTINKESELKNDVKQTNYDFFYHVASNNETFNHISSIYLIPEKYIIKANPNLQTPLREGEYVKIPVKDAFDILDGKTQSVTNSKTSNSDNYNPYIVNTENKQSKKSTKTTRIKPVSHKNKTQAVSFNPNIPIIKDYRHVVIMGETTKSIAQKYGISVEILKSANSGLGNSVAKGDRLRIPDKTKLNKELPNSDNSVNLNKQSKAVTHTNSNVKQDTTIQVKTAIITHKVKKKETLYSIGREYGVTVDEILKSNKGLTTSLKIGQIIFIPKKKINKPYIIHKATKKTKPSKVAKLYRIPTYQIMDFNPNIGKRIAKNEEVRIPVGSHAIIVPFVPDNSTITSKEAPDETINPEIFPVTNCVFSPDTNKIFKVALMVPFSVEETDSINKEHFLLSPQRHFIPFRFIQFYEGALIALDSLTKQGMKVEMYVYDVDKNITKTAKVLQRRELRAMNLIIGPFYNTSFNQIALFAGNFNIPIVNPLSYRDAIVNKYSTVIKAKPSYDSQLPIIETFVDRYANNSKVFLISQTSYTDADKVVQIKNDLSSILKPQIKISNQYLLNLSYSVAQRDTLFDALTDLPPMFKFEGANIYPKILDSLTIDSTIINNNLIKINYSTDSLHPFLDNASPLRNNLVILYGSKKSFILDALNRLNESRDTFDIQLIGMPAWERISNLSNIKMSNLNLTYFSSEYINYDDETTQDFISKFINKYSIEPDEYAYSGFDITYYFLNSLFYLGDNFNECLETFNIDLLKSKHQYRRVGNTNNFENNYWHMLQFNNMSLFKISDELLVPEKQQTNYE